MNELKELCKPLQDYLIKNHNIHTEIVVEIDRITVKQDIEGIPASNENQQEVSQ